MRRLIVFTHIDKTSGTSFIDTVLKPNYPVGIGGIMQGAGIKGNLIALMSGPTVLFGHTPYGIHHLTRRPVDYITFLRDPVDRAVSFYYFLRSPYFPAHYKHPFYAYANSVSLAEFYQDRRFQNWQTRYLAGFLPHRLYPFLSRASYEHTILNSALKHLTHRYVCFGLQERFDDSIRLFQKTFAWKKSISVEPQMKTPERPRLEDLDEATLTILQDAHRLDHALYAYAQARFDILLNG